ncbi:hypothetical protein FKW77_003051 [Venturia effusa]|uniref:BRCT domain-containing protein n=1 Tax=Venturia effusa TaxID=50376 RepID=A0A517LAL9_9PEZI|nr:hypothetical protein FKW77_003051 [Venturia effusa]
MSSHKRKRDDGEETFHMVEHTLDYPTDDVGTTYWTYKLYRGPSGEKVRVTYCRKLAETEAAMRRISNSSVLGFDLEYKPYGGGPNIKDQVSVIQLASESDIIVIHLAAFPGDRDMTRQQLLGPALRRILEDQSIIKVGLRISGDGNLLRDNLGVYMRGAVDVAKLRPTQPRLTNPSLATLTDIFFGMPLDKSLSTSPWHRERALKQNECDYAATDAYAGLKLYQHFMAGDHNATGLRFVDFRASGRKKFEPRSLLEKLKRLRLELTADPETTVFNVANNQVLEAIAKYRPTTLSALSNVPGFKSSTLLKYKKAIIELVQNHMNVDSLNDDIIDIDSSPNSSQDTLEVAGAPNCLAGLSFVVTGVLPTLSRDDAQKLIKKFGGKMTKSTSGTTSYVVLGKDPGSKKVEQIKIFGLDTLDEEGLIELINTRDAPRHPSFKASQDQSLRSKKKTGKGSKIGASSSTSSSFVFSQPSRISSQVSGNSSQESTFSSHFSSPSTLLSSSQTAHPLPSSAGHISISSQESEASSSSSSEDLSASQQSSTSQSTTIIYNTLYFLRQELSQYLNLSPEEVATDDLLETLADVRPASRRALRNLGGDPFAEMAEDYDGSDVLEICREG